MRIRAVDLSIRQVLASVVLLVVGGFVNAADFRITGIDLQGDRADVRFASDPGYYYLLWRGETVSEIRLATDLGLGDGLERFLSDTNSGVARFYRVEKVSTLTPRDTDGDGLDDVWELMNRHAEAALNGADADEDQNGNGVEDRLDWLRQSLRQGATRSRPVVSAGGSHTLALKSDSSLWSWGGNLSGELGIPSLLDTNAPARVGADTNWMFFEAGDQYSYGLRSDGTLWAWGGNWNGRLGLAGPRTITTPTQVGMDADWVTVTGNGNTSLGLKSDGTIWNWPAGGTNIPVRLGTNSSWVALAGRSFSMFGLRSDGTLWTLGSPLGTGPAQIGTDSNWCAIAGGIYHALAIKSDGTLWAWSLNQLGSFYGQLGIPGVPTSPTRVGTESNWVAVSGGLYHSLGLKTDGTLWAWGDNSLGQLGLPIIAGTNPLVPLTVSAPTQVGTRSDWIAISAGLNHSVGLRVDGTISTWGDNPYGQLGIGFMGPVRTPTQLGTETNWIDVAAGRRHSLSRTADGELFAWGHNVQGQLGLGTYENTFQLMQVGTGTDWREVAGGRSHTLAIKSDGSLWAWGENAYGELGIRTNVRTNVATQVGEDTNWVAIAAGGQHSTGIKSDGSLWTWGRGDSTGALGTSTSLNTNRPMRVGAETNWMSLSSEGIHTTALKRNGSLWAWGGSPSSTPAQVGGLFSFNWVSVTTGESHNLAIKNDGTLWSWGDNTFGQLGNGGPSGSQSPTQVGTETNWAAAAVGEIHSVALKSDGSLWTWGSYVSGALGLNVATNVVAPVRVGTETNWVSIAAGGNHTLATKSDGTVWAWGDNSSGQVAQPAVWEPAAVVGTGWGAPLR